MTTNTSATDLIDEERRVDHLLADYENAYECDREDYLLLWDEWRIAQEKLDKRKSRP